MFYLWSKIVSMCCNWRTLLYFEGYGPLVEKIEPRCKTKRFIVELKDFKRLIGHYKSNFRLTTLIHYITQALNES